MLTLLHTINALNSAILFSKTRVKITQFNNLTLNVLLTLQHLNVIDSFILNKTHTQCTIILPTTQSSLVFQQIQSVSTPHKYIYMTYSELVKLRAVDLSSEYLISSNHNKIIMTSSEAIRHHIGGLVLLKLYL